MNDSVIEPERYRQSLVEWEKGRDPKEIGKSMINLGMATFSTGKLDEALIIVDKAIEIARQANDTASLASYLGKRGVILFEMGKFEKAQECFLSVLDLADKTGNQAHKCDALGNLGLILASTGDPEGCMEKLNEALAIARQMGDSSRELTQLGNIAYTYLQVANIRESIRIYTLAIEISRKIGDRKSEAGYLNNLGVIYNHISQHDLMIKTFEQVIEISTEIDDKNLTFNALQHLAKGSFIRGEAEATIQYCRQALDLLPALKSTPNQRTIRDLLITSLIQEEHFREALDEIQKDLEKARLDEDKERELILLGQLADIYYQTGELQHSVSVFRLALDLAVRLNSKFLEGRLAGRLGALYADLGDYGQSTQYIERAIRLAGSEKDMQTLGEQYFMRALNYREMDQLSDACNDCQQSIAIFKKIGLISQAQQVQNYLADLQVS